ncbi:hypothetical protein ACJIZ3_008105 [Penstemon smallii]|uniref:NLP1-9 GAF domain-containing protein n=1 Tax=Penstemon smallii TaxID=265156 RepID=A0ABD3T8V7_9LAMI
MTEKLGRKVGRWVGWGEGGWVLIRDGLKYPKVDMPISEKRYSCSEVMENAEEYFAYWAANDHLSATVYWKPELNVPPGSSSSASSVKQRAFTEKIIHALGEISSRNYKTTHFLQFWAHKEFDGRSYLTNIDQPFVVGGKKHPHAVTMLYTYLNHNHSLKHRYYVGDEEEVEGVIREEEIGPPGRVFRNGHPEFTPHLSYYSAKQHPLSFNAIRCGLKAYMALPVFDDLDQHCFGVLEYLTFEVGFTDYEIQALHQGLKAAKLRSTHTSISVPIRNEVAAQEINEMLQGIIKTPQVGGALVWVPCGQCAPSTSCMKLKSSCFSEPPFEFIKASKFHGVQMGKGVAGIALESENKLFFCESICHFSIVDYPLAHFAQRARLDASFAVCLQSSHTGNGIYVIEFFLQYPAGSKHGCPTVFFLLKEMKRKLKSFKVASGRQLGEELVVKVINFENFNFKFGHHDNTFPLKLEITRYGHEMKRQYLRNHQVQVTSDSAENRVEEEQDNAAAAYLEKGATVIKDMPISGKQYPFSELMENAEEYFADWATNDHLFATVYWKPELNLPPESSSSASPVKQRAIREKIIHALGEISSLNSNTTHLLQFWAHRVYDGRSYLTNVDQPFVVGGKRHLPAVTMLYTYLRHKRSLKHRYYVGGEEEGEGVIREEEIGPPGRVFRNGHPEFSPHLSYYSTKEHPLCFNALRCGLKAYMALPVFDDLDQHCFGVLEYLTFEVGFEDYEIQALDQGLKAAKLRSTHTNMSVQIHNEVAAQEINEMLQGVIKSPQVGGALVWVPCDQCAHSTSCMKLKSSFFSEPPFEFIKASKFHGVQMGKGVAGIALESENKLCFCEGLCHFRIIDYPLTHFAQRARLNASFAICLQSSHTGNNIYVIEFFLLYPTGNILGCHPVLFLLKEMKRKLKSFKVASGKQLGEELVVKVIDFENFNFKFGHHDNTFPFKLEITRNGHEMKRQNLRNHQVQVTSDPSENRAEEEQDNAAANSEKGVATMESNREGNKMKRSILYEVPKPHSGKKLPDVLENLRDCGINSWPSTKKNKKSPDAIFEAAANARECSQCSFSGSSSPPPVVPLHENVSQNEKSANKSQNLAKKPKNN